MVDRRILQERGVSSEAWRPLFEAAAERKFLTQHRAPSDPPPKPHQESTKVKDDETEEDSPETKLDSFLGRMWARIVSARDYNLTSFRTYYALDLLWDAPFRQMSPTLLASIAKGYNSQDEVKDALKTFGFNIEDVIVKVSERDPKTNDAPIKVNVPAFFTIMVPLVRAYLNIRRAKLVNDRNTVPLIRYSPTIRTKLNQVRCDALESRVETMSSQYGYLDDLNQDVFAMLLYGRSIEFTLEEWHTEEQTLYRDGDPQDVIVKAGLRYTHPHPSRTYWDMAYPIKTLNTDVGCQWVGYWRILRYGELSNSTSFYNKDRITIGNTDWWTAGPANWFWNTVYPCVVKVPVPSVPDSVDDREAYLSSNPYYTPDMRDASVMVVEHREKIIPSECGLGDYDKPVWARFVVAGDGTVIYAGPMFCKPVNVYKDNGDEKRREDASMALQIAPFQDQLSNLLTQYILSVKQNLVNLTLVDTNVFDQATIKKLRNLGEGWYRGLNLVDYDSKKQFKMLNNPQQTALFSHRFQAMDTNSIMQAMKIVIDLAERVLQFSSQEIAQAATHQQTKAEVEKIYETTSNLLDYTGLPIDQGLEAKGGQIYEAIVNNDDDEFTAQISSDHGLSREQLSEIGIELQGDDFSGNKRVPVKVKKSALEMLGFAYVSAVDESTTDIEAAGAMATFVRDVMSNPITAQAIGSKQAIDLANQIAKLAGIRLDVPLSDKTAENQQQGGGQQQLQQVAEAVLNKANESSMVMMKEGLVPVLNSIKGLTEKVAMIYSALNIPVPSNAPNNQNRVGPEPGGGIEEMAQPGASPNLPPVGPV